MSKFAIRILISAICAASMALAPTVTSAKTEASSSKHARHKKKVVTTTRSWSANQAWRENRGWGSSSQPSKTCFRAFECATWPPPFDEDPDRKASGTDQ